MVMMIIIIISLLVWRCGYILKAHYVAVIGNVMCAGLPCHALFPSSWHLLVITGCPVRSAGGTRVLEVIPDPSGGLMTQPPLPSSLVLIY